MERVRRGRIEGVVYDDYIDDNNGRGWAIIAPMRWEAARRGGVRARGVGCEASDSLAGSAGAVVRPHLDEHTCRIPQVRYVCWSEVTQLGLPRASSHLM